MVIVNVIVAVLGTFVPARRISGSLPAVPPPTVVWWIEETLEVVIDTTGRVAEMRPLRATKMPTDLLEHSVADWRFRPASDRGRAVQSRVLVAAIFRPPALYDTPMLGAAPVDRAVPSDEIPLPIVTAPPRYPPLAVGDAVVLLEVLVNPHGRIRQVRVMTGAPTFDQASLDAASRWSFRPARHNQRAVEAYAYLVFAFRQPTALAGLYPIRESSATRSMAAYISPSAAHRRMRNVVVCSMVATTKR
jgi:TonB family protein